MCSVCLQTPCHPRCPNAPEEIAKYECVLCGSGIFQEDQYFESEDGPVCGECIGNMTPLEVLEMLGETMKKA